MDALLRILLFHLLMCIGPNALGSEIINGKKVPDKLMLYMASVQNSKGEHSCGGFLINKQFVVTAAHCSDPTSVILGTHNLKKIDNRTMRYPVERACKYPSYQNVKSGNDIMLLKLSKKAQLGNSIQPIQLPKAEINLKQKKKCRVAGWGSTKSRGRAVDVLQVVDVPFIALEVCKRKWEEVSFTLPENVICAGGLDKKGFCQGDSGGPLVCGNEVVGVVSFNMRGECKYPNVPNVYTDVSKYLKWIKDIIKKREC